MICDVGVAVMPSSTRIRMPLMYWVLSPFAAPPNAILPPVFCLSVTSASAVAATASAITTAHPTRTRILVLHCFLAAGPHPRSSFDVAQDDPEPVEGSLARAFSCQLLSEAR